MANVSATFPRSFCAFASARVFPASVCSLLVSIGRVMRTRACGAAPAVCTTRADVKPKVSAPQYSKLTKKDLVRKFFGIRHPRKISTIGVRWDFSPLAFRRDRRIGGFAPRLVCRLARPRAGLDPGDCGNRDRVAGH
jgi:hypothetical protein